MANITKVYLLSVPLENDYRDTLYFANATAQHNYFAGQVVKSYTDFSYQRKDSVIRVPAIVDSIRNCNYVMYQNSAYSNKWFYAFINRMVYVDDGRTDIYISTDVLQTWMFEMDFKDSFIEREHVDDDTIGIHTMPEGLDTGEYICNDTQDVYYAKKQYWNLNDTPFLGQTMICVQVSTLTLKKDNVTTEPTNIPAKSIVNGIPQASYIVAMPYNEDAMAGIYTLTGAYDGAGRGDNMPHGTVITAINRIVLFIQIVLRLIYLPSLMVTSLITINAMLVLITIFISQITVVAILNSIMRTL